LPSVLAACAVGMVSVVVGCCFGNVRVASGGGLNVSTPGAATWTGGRVGAGLCRGAGRIFGRPACVGLPALVGWFGAASALSARVRVI
jgi:hypothetical protein